MRVVDEKAHQRAVSELKQLRWARTDNVGRRRFNVAAAHRVGLVVNERLASEVGADLLVEEDKGRVEGRIRLVVARAGGLDVTSELLALALKVLVVLDDLVLAPVDRVNFGAEEGQRKRHPLGRR